MTIKSWSRSALFATLVVAGALTMATYAYLQHPKFGSLPEGARLRAIQQGQPYRLLTPIIDG